MAVVNTAAATATTTAINRMIATATTATAAATARTADIAAAATAPPAAELQRTRALVKKAAVGGLCWGDNEPITANPACQEEEA